MTAASDEPTVSVPEISVPETPAEAEWPPREWREAQRGAGATSMYRLLGLIALIMVILVAVSFWGLANG
ncbi:hypothetical protein ABH920_008192 [Catenulispora sp. EB89]|uniref:hypothetical protein n=1 Tax=Catenulispora sp. EB89 TaxID=3156257 RepID=UPI003519951C